MEDTMTEIYFDFEVYNLVYSILRSEENLYSIVNAQNNVFFVKAHERGWQCA